MLVENIRLGEFARMGTTNSVMAPLNITVRGASSQSAAVTEQFFFRFQTADAAGGAKTIVSCGPGITIEQSTPPPGGPYDGELYKFTIF